MTIQKLSIPGGDDVNAVVVDIGSCNFRAGFAGEDVPRVFESSDWRLSTDSPMSNVEMGCPIGKPANYFSRTNAGDVKQALTVDAKTGLINVNEDIFEEIIGYSFNSSRGFAIDMSESPLIMTEPNKTSNKYRKTCMESSLEKFGFPAVSMLRRASASAFAVGKASGLVVDIGASMTSMVPIYDGFVMQKPIIEHQSIGGDLLDTILHEVLKKKRFNVTPFYKDVTVGLSPSFVEKSRMAVVREIKHELCRTSPTPLSGVAGYSNWSMTSTTSTTTSVLPDGTNVDLGPISQVIPELLFDPTPVSVIPNLSSSMSGFDGITTSALECVANCDVDIRKQVSSDIILTGGSSLFPGMPDRLLKSLSSPSTQQSSQRVLVHIPKCKVTATPVSIDRMSSSWLGCSILASCATFQQMWITKDQLAEDGFDRIVNRQLFW